MKIPRPRLLPKLNSGDGVTALIAMGFIGAGILMAAIPSPDIDETVPDPVIDQILQQVTPIPIINSFMVDRQGNLLVRHSVEVVIENLGASDIYHPNAPKLNLSAPCEMSYKTAVHLDQGSFAGWTLICMDTGNLAKELHIGD